MLMTATTLTLASCGDEGGGSGSDSDDDFEHSGNVVSSADICNFGGQRLTEIIADFGFGSEGSYSYNYNPDGSFNSFVYDEYSDRIALDYESGAFYEDNNKGIFETNDKGYVTGIYFNDNDDDESYDYSFQYDNANHLIKATLAYGSEGGSHKEYYTWFLTWEDDLITKITKSSGRCLLETSVFVYENAVKNRHSQYTKGFWRSLFFDEAPSELLYIGLLGKGPAYYPTRVSLSEYGTDEICTYVLNSSGLVRQETLESDYYETNYYYYYADVRNSSL